MVIPQEALHLVAEVADLQLQHAYFHHEACPEAFPDSTVGRLGVLHSDEVQDMEGAEGADSCFS